MPVPRLTIPDYLVSIYQTILLKNQYHQDVQTVELRKRLSRDLNDSECPAIIIESGLDKEERNETIGHPGGDTFFRNWQFELYLFLRNPGNDDISTAGEEFLADVWRCTLTNRFNKPLGKSQPRDIRFPVIDSKNFAQMENGFAEFHLSIHVLYDFTPGDLQQ
jgi:hypothetical protein